MPSACRPNRHADHAARIINGCTGAEISCATATMAPLRTCTSRVQNRQSRHPWSGWWRTYEIFAADRARNLASAPQSPAPFCAQPCGANRACPRQVQLPPDQVVGRASAHPISPPLKRQLAACLAAIHFVCNDASTLPRALNSSFHPMPRPDHSRQLCDLPRRRVVAAPRRPDAQTRTTGQRKRFAISRGSASATFFGIDLQ